MYDVVLVDDEWIFLDYMQNIIRWEEYDCRITACKDNGMDALQYAEETSPDIIFLDICMPQRSGLDVCRKIKEKNIKSKLVIITGHDEFSFAYQAIKLGIDDYLLKPFDKKELINTLNKVIREIVNQEQNPSAERNNFDIEIKDIKEPVTKYKILTRKIEEYLSLNYTKSNLNLDLISSDLGFENSYLRRIYKWETGNTIMQKLEKLRLEHAKDLLLSGYYRNQEIAQKVGFSDQYYFSKRFKQICGMTPSEFKKKKSSL